MKLTATKRNQERKAEIAFPSPCGDLVMKLSKDFELASTKIDILVSVPLRGFGYETIRLLLAGAITPLLVSVPLRGFGYETVWVQVTSGNPEDVTSFRPLAGIWL